MKYKKILSKDIENRNLIIRIITVIIAAIWMIIGLDFMFSGHMTEGLLLYVLCFIFLLLADNVVIFKEDLRGISLLGAIKIKMRSK